MRKKAQEKKRETSPSSSSTSTTTSNFSSSSNSRAVNSKTATETTTESFDSTVVPNMSALQGKKDESEEEEYYSMDDIWKDITSEEPIKPVGDGYREGSNFSCPPMASPLWEYCPDTLWRTEGDESKMFLPTSDQFVPCYQHEHMSLTG